MASFNRKPKSIIQHRKLLKMAYIWFWVHWLAEHAPKSANCQFAKFGCFSSSNLFFYHFHFFFFFWQNIKFPQQNFNQSENRIANKKLSVELVVFQRDILNILNNIVTLLRPYHLPKHYMYKHYKHYKHYMYTYVYTIFIIIFITAQRPKAFWLEI